MLRVKKTREVVVMIAEILELSVQFQDQVQREEVPCCQSPHHRCDGYLEGSRYYLQALLTRNDFKQYAD